MKVRMIRCEYGKITEDIEAKYSKDDYNVSCRIWVRSDGEPIREWTAEEYINSDPNDKIIINTKINNAFIDVEAHCRELRQYYAYKDGKVMTSFQRVHDYTRDKI